MLRDRLYCCEIYEQIGGRTDDSTGNWIEEELNLKAEALIDIQPKRGGQRVGSLNTRYESEYTGYLYCRDIDYIESLPAIEQGDLIKCNGKEYRVIFPGFWGTHYELDLKEEK